MLVVNAAPFSDRNGINTKFKIIFTVALTAAAIKNLLSRLAGNKIQYASIQLNTDTSNAGQSSLKELPSRSHRQKLW